MQSELNVETLCATLGATKEQHMAERLPDSALPHTDRINRSAIFIVGCLAAPTLVVCCRPCARRSCTDTCKTPSLHSRDTAKQNKISIASAVGFSQPGCVTPEQIEKLQKLLTSLPSEEF